VLEGPVSLDLIVAERLFQALQALPLALGAAVRSAQGVLDALHGADRMAGVEVRRVGPGTADEKVGHRRGGLAAAQDFEAP